MAGRSEGSSSSPSKRSDPWVLNHTHTYSPTNTYMQQITRWDGPPPYLGIWEQISLAWIRSSIIAILIIGFALWIGATTAVAGIKDAKGALTEACAASEKVATVAANLPHYVAGVVSGQVNAAIVDVLQGAHKALGLLLSAMTSIVRYFLQIVNGVIKFVLQFIVAGALAVVTDFTASAQQTLNGAVGGIASGIKTALDGAVSGVNTVIRRVNDIISDYNDLPFLSSISPFNTVSINFDLSRIRNFRVPNTVADSLSGLSSKLPNLDSFIDSIDNTIAGPVRALETQMNTTFSNINPPIVDIPIPAVGAVQYCNKLNIGFLDELGDDILWAMRVGLGILAAVAFIIFLGHAFLLWIIWRIELKGNSLAGKFWTRAQSRAAAARGPRAVSEKEGVHDEPVASTSQSTAPKNAVIPLTRHNILALDNPFSTWTAATVLSLIPFIHPSEASRDRLAWFFAYIFSIHPLICFTIGLYGILALSFQLILINIVRRRIDREVANLIDEVIDAVGGAVNSLLSSAGGEVASGLNTALDGIDTAINKDLNSWISTAVGAFGQLWTSASSTLQLGLTQAFTGTPLSTPMRSLAQTIADDSQVATSVSRAQTYLQQNLHLSVPRIDPKVFLLRNSTLEEISDTLARAAVGGDGSQGVFGLIFDRYTKLIKNLMVLFGSLLAIWGVVVLMALGILLVDIIRHRGAVKEGEATTQPEMSEKENPVVKRDVDAANEELPAPVEAEDNAEPAATASQTAAADGSATKSAKGLRRLLPLLSHKEQA